MGCAGSSAATFHGHSPVRARWKKAGIAGSWHLPGKINQEFTDKEQAG